MTRRSGRRAPPPLVGPRFDVVARFRPFELLSERFVAVRDEPAVTEGMNRSGYSPPAPFVTVEVEVGPGPAGSSGTVVAGLASESDEHLLVAYDARARRISLEIRTGGLTSVLAAARVLRRPRRLAFVLCENQATVLVGTRRGWRPILTERHRIGARLDFRVPATLGRFTTTWGARGGTSDLRMARAGLFGMVGLRDLHLVQHADGAPYIADDRMYFTATCAGPGFFRQAHWGVFAVDVGAMSVLGPDAEHSGTGLAEPITLRLEQTAHLFSQRDGMLLGDHAGQLVRDGNRWLVATSSWGDFAPHRGVHVRHLATDDDLLHGVHLLGTQPTALPTSTSSWDPGMTRVGGRWFVSFVESPSQEPFVFRPALAAGPTGAPSAGRPSAGRPSAGGGATEPTGEGRSVSGEWSEALEKVGAATELTRCEGPVLAEPDGPGSGWRLLASDGRARRFLVFDLDMNEVGELDAPYGSNIPHPQVVDVPGGPRLLVTFDGTPYARRALGYGTHGDVVVMRSGR